MSKNNENKLVPRLRFPEFINDKWAEVSISKLGETISGLAGKSGKDFGTGRPFVTFKQVFDSAKVDFSKCSLVEIAENENQNTLSKGDILFTTSSETPHEVGFASVVLTEPNEPTYLNSFCFAFRPISIEQLQPAFSQFLFHSPAYRKSIGILAQGITRFNISKGAFLKLKVSLPKNQKEQQKIAACLSSLDEVITAESQKLEVLKDHKRGLLQNLLPVGKETIPKLRFKEFQNADEWNEDTLANIASFRRGSFPQPYGLPKWYDDENGMPFIQVFDVGEDFRLKPTTKRKISSLAAEQSVFIPKGTLIITIQGSIGRVAITQYDAYIDRTLLLFEEFYQEVDITFFAYTIFLLFEIEKQKAPGGIIKTITKEVLSSFVVKLPSIEEQQKIASCLTSLDELISAQTEKIESLQFHKKGLLQGLFPNVNEVTE